jgi:hypothetical protein
MGRTEGVLVLIPNKSRVDESVYPSGAAAVRSRMRRVTWYVSSAFAVIVVVVGSLGTGAARASPHAPTQLRRALTVWAHFPVNASNRPVVLIGNDNVNAPSGGFSDDDYKMAFLDGSIITPTDFPAGPASADRLPVMSAAEAFGLLQGQPAKVPTGDMTLDVTSIDFGTGLFQTDRGVRRLPAWLFQFQGVQDPAEVLAISPAALFSPRQVGDRESTVAATLGPNDRTLTVSFAGAPAGNGPCDASYAMGVAESKTVVAVWVHGVVTKRPAKPTSTDVTNTTIPVACALPAYPRHLTTGLPGPLGNRVVVDAFSLAAVPVIHVSR